MYGKLEIQGSRYYFRSFHSLQKIDNFPKENHICEGEI